MDKVSDPWSLAVVKVCLSLGYLVVVVRKLEVNASCVDVEASSQDGGSHDCAFNVPSWSSRAKLFVAPKRLSRLWIFPKSEVLWIRLFAVVLRCLGDLLLSAFLGPEFDILVLCLEGDCVKVNRARGCCVSVAALNELRNEVHNLVDVVAHTGD